DEDIGRRIGKKVIEYGGEQVHEEMDTDEFLTKELPVDLLSYGLIPELIGRIPVIASLKPLDEEALIEILTKPKNALVKQYKKLFQIDNVELEFEEDALVAIAKDAIERKTGARGLRSIIENIMLDIMFEIPSRDDIEKWIITKETVVDKHVRPKLQYTDGTVEESKKSIPKESS